MKVYIVRWGHIVWAMRVRLDWESFSLRRRRHPTMIEFLTEWWYCITAILGVLALWAVLTACTVNPISKLLKIKGPKEKA